ncbi:hypothetical protein T492DRAFT_884727 [Pavlovales sp. CCMP2436]|nr:hypothetical protein T492DRAFT_884727 [Pavlovales sp. CCMP2436]
MRASFMASAASVLGEANANWLLNALRQAAEEDPLLFTDPAFSLEPSEGLVYPGCHAEVTITFSPSIAGMRAVRSS